MSVLIGADFVPTESNWEHFKSGDIKKIVDAQLLDILQRADYTIFNLETPLVDKEEPILKCGPNLRAPEDSINGYKALGVSLLTLANNHIMDQGDQGLNKTISLLNGFDINYVGAGNNLHEAIKERIVEIRGKKYGVYACTEHEFSIATENFSGANPFDPLNSYDHIVDIKSKCDYVIVLYHGGKEHYRYPSPYLKKVCEKFVEKGADLVLCQHSHCIGCEEKYKGSTIVYGQGNFLFDNSDNEYWQTGLLVQISDDFKIEYIPIRKAGNKVKLADDEDEILSQFFMRSEQIKEPNCIKTKYKEFAESNIPHYLSIISGFNQGFIFRALNKITRYKFERWFTKKQYNRVKKTVIQNIIECEAHRELLIEGLKNLENH